MTSTQLTLGLLITITVCWVWNALYYLHSGRGWRGFVEGLGKSGFVALWLSSYVLFVVLIMSGHPFSGDEFRTVALIELGVFVLSAALCFMPGWFPISDDVEGK